MTNEVAAGLQEAADTAAQGSIQFLAAKEIAFMGSGIARLVVEKTGEFGPLLQELASYNVDFQQRVSSAGTSVRQATGTLHQVAGNPPPEGIEQVVAYFDTIQADDVPPLDPCRQDIERAAETVAEFRTAFTRLSRIAEKLVVIFDTADGHADDGIRLVNTGIEEIRDYAHETQQPFTMPALPEAAPE